MPEKKPLDPEKEARNEYAKDKAKEIMIGLIDASVTAVFQQLFPMGNIPPDMYEAMIDNVSNVVNSAHDSYDTLQNAIEATKEELDEPEEEQQAGPKYTSDVVSQRVAEQREQLDIDEQAVAMLQRQALGVFRDTLGEMIAISTIKRPDGVLVDGHFNVKLKAILANSDGVEAQERIKTLLSTHRSQNPSFNLLQTRIMKLYRTAFVRTPDAIQDMKHMSDDLYNIYVDVFGRGTASKQVLDVGLKFGSNALQAVVATALTNAGVGLVAGPVGALVAGVASTIVSVAHDEIVKKLNKMDQLSADERLAAAEELTLKSYQTFFDNKLELSEDEGKELKALLLQEFIRMQSQIELQNVNEQRPEILSLVDRSVDKLTLGQYSASIELASARIKAETVPPPLPTEQEAQQIKAMKEAQRGVAAPKESPMNFPDAAAEDVRKLAALHLMRNELNEKLDKEKMALIKLALTKKTAANSRLFSGQQNQTLNKALMDKQFSKDLNDYKKIETQMRTLEENLKTKKVDIRFIAENPGRAANEASKRIKTTPRGPKRAA